ncbi:MAG: hypothetical protein AVDCRST_MAG68-703, partial [uncultured Gemmatimonadetes bacterium]
AQRIRRSPDRLPACPGQHLDRAHADRAGARLLHLVQRAQLGPRRRAPRIAPRRARAAAPGI